MLFQCYRGFLTNEFRFGDQDFTGSLLAKGVFCYVTGLWGGSVGCLDAIAWSSIIFILRVLNEKIDILVHLNFSRRSTVLALKLNLHPSRAAFSHWYVCSNALCFWSLVLFHSIFAIDCSFIFRIYIWIEVLCLCDSAVPFRHRSDFLSRCLFAAFPGFPAGTHNLRFLWLRHFLSLLGTRTTWASFSPSRDDNWLGLFSWK
jgi:hypothetical protein